MRCPKCGNEVRPSKKYPGYYLCDTCKKRYAASSVLAAEDDYDDYEDYEDYEQSDNTSQPDSANSYDYYDTPKSVKSGPSPRARSTSKAKKARKGSRKSNRSKKKGGILKVILLILLALIMLGFAANALGLIDFKKDNTKKNDKTTETQPKDKDNSGADAKDTYSVGETADYKNVQIQLIGYEESAGNDWGAPAEGNIFVFVNLEVANNSDSEISVSSMASFTNYCGDYKLDYSSNAFTALATDSEKQQMDGSIASGKKLNGYLCLEVPADWTTIEIHYSESIWSDSNIKFVINK